MTRDIPTTRPGPETELGGGVSFPVPDRFTSLSRRGFLRSGAVAGFGLAGLAASDTAAASHQTESAGTLLESVLNYALTLERLEAALYDTAVGQAGVFSRQDVAGSTLATRFADPALRASVFDHLVDVRDHERTHVVLIEDALADLGGQDRAATQFVFPDGVFDSPETFIAFARYVEDLGVAAYAGAAPTLLVAEMAATNGRLADLQLTPAALGIHSVEARHAGYLRTLSGARPWETGLTGAIDEPLRPGEVVAAARGYIEE